MSINKDMCGHIRFDLIGQNTVFLSFISWVGWIIVSKKQVHKSSGRIELFQLDKSGIKVAEYMTELPKRKLLEQKLHKAVEMARKQLEASPTNGNTGDR
ncbi:MAG: hypothetical protein ABIN18_25785 [Pseudomonadota bacterium]